MSAYRLAPRAVSALLQLHTRTVPRNHALCLSHAGSPIRFRPLQHGSAPFSLAARTKLAPSLKTTYTTLAASVLLFLAFSNSSLHRLESQESDEPESVNLVYERYKPSTDPVGLKTADEILHWDQNSQPMQAGSNVLRYDTVRIASNPDVEDYVLLATGRDDDELKWIIAGIFDGHA